MNVLNRKLYRELWMIRGQVLAIAIVIASGLSTVIMSYNTLQSLQQTRERYYQEYGFADLFVSLKRAPLSLINKIKAIDGIDEIEQRVVAPVRINLTTFNDPIQGQLVSLFNDKINEEHDKKTKHTLNNVFIREGRLPDINNENEVLISEAFAQPHQLHPGDQMTIVINGHLKNVQIVGIALAPEFIYQIAPGTIIPDFSRFGIVWMNHDALAAAYDMKQSFNSLTISLKNNINSDQVKRKLDFILKDYGGLGAYDRDLQVSHRFLSEEFKQLDAMGQTFSIVFLGVSIFLLNIVVGRIIDSQRDIIATLKAFGLTTRAITWHYYKLIISIVLIGIFFGLAIGLFLGNNLAHLYMDYYRFPYLDYQIQLDVILYSIIITLSASILGTGFALKRVIKLQPAEAMRPVIPMHYKVSLLEKWGLKHYLSQPNKMILRHFEGHPVKAFFSVSGTAFACGIMIVGTFSLDSMDVMIDTEFNLSQREQLSLTMTHPLAYQAVHEISAVPGVWRVEPFRTTPVIMYAGAKSHRTAILGLEQNNQLHRVLDVQNKPIRMPQTGMLISEFLANKLDVSVGDWLNIGFLDKTHQPQKVQITGVAKQYIGLSGYMNIDALNELLNESQLISGAYLGVQDGMQEQVQTMLKQFPNIAGISNSRATIDSFYDTVGEFIYTYIFFISGLSIAVAFGVIYNNARITLAERSRELASLRVLGFSRAEVNYILLGELALITLLAIPFGLLVGYWMSYGFILGLQQDLFRFPLLIHSSTYASAVIVILIAAVISGIIVRYKLNQLELVSVLKIKE